MPIHDATHDHQDQICRRGRTLVFNLQQLDHVLALDLIDLLFAEGRIPVDLSVGPYYGLDYVASQPPSAECILLAIATGRDPRFMRSLACR